MKNQIHFTLYSPDLAVSSPGGVAGEVRKPPRNVEHPECERSPPADTC